MDGYLTEEKSSRRIFDISIIDRRLTDGWLNDKKTKWQKAICQGSIWNIRKYFPCSKSIFNIKYFFVVSFELDMMIFYTRNFL